LEYIKGWCGRVGFLEFLEWRLEVVSPERLVGIVEVEVEAGISVRWVGLVGRSTGLGLVA
jgi:hypothetical protein